MIERRVPDGKNLRRVLHAGGAGDEASGGVFHGRGAQGVVFERKVEFQILDVFAEARREPLLLHFGDGGAALAAGDEELHQHRLVHGRKIHRRVHGKEEMDAIVVPLVVKQIEARWQAPA